MEVEFFSGPNLVNYQYTVACFPLDSITCSGVIGGGILPIDSVSGSLPRGYSRVLANMTVRDLYESMTIADSLPLPFLGSYCAVSGSPCLTVPLSSSVSCPHLTICDAAHHTADPGQYGRGLLHHGWRGDPLMWSPSASLPARLPLTRVCTWLLLQTHDASEQSLTLFLLHSFCRFPLGTPSLSPTWRETLRPCW